jgi:hypothetical protein
LTPIRRRLTGALIGGAFGTVFVVANATTPLGQTAAVVFRILGVVGFSLVLIAWRRALRGADTRPADRPDAGAVNLFRRPYWAIVAGEAAMLAVGFVAIWGMGAPSQTYLAWTALIVGLHFIAFRLADVWRGGIVRPAALLTLFGVSGLVLAASADAGWIALVSGVFSGFTLLAGSLSVAAREARSLPTRPLGRSATTPPRTGATAERHPHAR